MGCQELAHRAKQHAGKLSMTATSHHDERCGPRVGNERQGGMALDDRHRDVRVIISTEDLVDALFEQVSRIGRKVKVAGPECHPSVVCRVLPGGDDHEVSFGELGLACPRRARVERSPIRQRRPRLVVNGVVVNGGCCWLVLSSLLLFGAQRTNAASCRFRIRCG